MLKHFSYNEYRLQRANIYECYCWLLSGPSVQLEDLESNDEKDKF